MSEPDAATTHLEDPPLGRKRRRVVWFVRALLLVQMIVPLTYYLGADEDPYDERFAWRMFSAVRLHSCDTTAIETTADGPRSIPLPQTLHQAWVHHLQRNRRDVVLAFLDARCEVEGVTKVEVRNDCTAPDGTALEPQVYTLDCESGERELPAGFEVAR